MGRRLRFIPEGGSLVEVTCRTLQGRFLLRPSPELRSLVLGVLARSQELYPVEIHAFVFLSNHYHLLLSVTDAHLLASFMTYLNSNLAREAGRLHDWEGRFWGRRYQAIVVSAEETAQVGRLRYILSQGCKEGLVSRPVDWPGAHSVWAILGSRSVSGLWFDRSREYAARERGERFDRLRYATRLRVRLTSLPCWFRLSRRGYSARIRELLREIEKETEARHADQGGRPIGVLEVMKLDPHARPERVKRSVAPVVHAATKAIRQELEEGYRWFVGAYREAAERLRQGETSTRFPKGSFPPRLPFVGWTQELKPG